MSENAQVQQLHRLPVGSLYSIEALVSFLRDVDGHDYVTQPHPTGKPSIVNTARDWLTQTDAGRAELDTLGIKTSGVGGYEIKCFQIYCPITAPTTVYTLGVCPATLSSYISDTLDDDERKMLVGEEAFRIAKKCCEFFWRETRKAEHLVDCSKFETEWPCHMAKRARRGHNGSLNEVESDLSDDE